MNKYRLAALSVAGGLLSGLAWSGWCTGLILLISLVPFFIIENYLYRNRQRYSTNTFFIYLLPGILIFSIMTLGWIRVASMVGALCVVLGTTFLMALVIWLVHIIRLKTGNTISVITLISFWLGYEYFNLNFDLVTPWMNLGNGLGKDILFIQWYEFTGASGGSLWIILSNTLISVVLIKSFSGRGKIIGYLGLWILIVFAPILASLSIYYKTTKPSGVNSGVVVVQPDFDPYSDKFRLAFDYQLKKAFMMAESEITPGTDWIITPETTVDDPVDEQDTGNNKYIKFIRNVATMHPETNIVIGMTSYKNYPPSPVSPTRSARKLDGKNSWYDHFNSAVKIDTGNTIFFYHKSKLVPGIEKQFITGPGKIISRILPSLGGTPWGYGTQNDRVCFEHSGTKVKAGPIVCYESVFGKYVTGYVRNGAGFLIIITNDGWWKNTNGYKQHLQFTSIRAIETRRCVARAANTGISCITDTRGLFICKSEWWQPAVLTGSVSVEKKLTFYVRNGDYILIAGTAASILIILIVFLIYPFYRKFS